ncbi:hypothetical protein BGZ72_006914 [Mortierella alpina]|nr:hypothetical protein BGZ72_006914 [Mortierella alpina]
MSRLSFCCPSTCTLRARSTVDLRTRMRLMSTLKRTHSLDGAPFTASAATAAKTPAMTSAYLVKRFYSPPPAKQHFYQNRILDPYVNQPVNPITLRQLVFFGRNMQADKLIKSANYVRTELPIRLAHRIRDFQNLPFIVGTNPHIERVYILYWQAFEALRTIPEIKTLEDNDAFCGLVKGLLNDHLVVIPQLALGIMESAKHLPAEMVDQFMNKMLRSRISRRVLAEQHISLTANYNSPNHMMTDRGYIGIIYTHCSPREIVERTAILAAETCRRQYAIECQRAGNGHGHGQQQGRRDRHGAGDTALEPPKVIMDGSIDAEFSYIPDHIEYILYELLKNSMRFVMLNAKPDPDSGELPPIQITVCEGTHDIVFRVSDKGGGIDPELESHLWSYSQSPARFANFQKISRMAATVQEQLVSPCRSADVGQDEVDEGAAVEQRGQDLHSGGRAGNEDHGTGQDLVLPPPPVNLKAGTAMEESLLLDRHSPSRTMASTITASTTPTNSTTTTPGPNASSSSSSSSPSPPSSGSTKAVIDPNQSSTPQKKAGHLNTEARQKTERQQDETMHLGIGLPMSRVYAEYWGGDLKVYTMHGYGTDAYARLCKFGNIYENFDV